MDHKKRIDKILDAVETRVQDEVATLLGSEFSIIEAGKDLVSKEQLFGRLSGKQVCAHLELSGDITGKGCLLIGIKDAIRLGGTLIMLPDLELQEVIGREDYREEIEDSYGEIANIIAGSVTKTFEEMYPKACRFIRKEQEVLSPAKVLIESDSPVVNETFYLMSSSMILEGRQMGDLLLAFPALPFGLAAESAADESLAETEASKPDDVKSAAPEVIQAEPSENAADDEVLNSSKDTKKSLPATVDFDKQKKKIDLLLEDCQKKLTGEVSALLGADIMFEGLDNQLLSKEKFFSEQVSGKQVLTNMEVVGDQNDTCYFSTDIKDAIHLGGVLIMLPPAELINVVNEEEFNDDARDAFGEVANIVSGVYTAVFEEQYSQKLRFIKKAFEEVVPLKVITDSAEPIPDQHYYSHTMQLFVAGKQLGILHMLFPARLLQMDVAPIQETSAAKKSTETAAAPPSSAKQPPQQAESAIDLPRSAVKKSGTLSGQSKEKAEKQKKLVDKLLIACQAKVADEVTALLGTDVQLTNQQTMVVGKEEFFLEGVSGKQVIAHMDVVGEQEGKSYLVVNLRDAIRIGGVLIMLPAQELESVVASEVFGDDSKDAYGEIANIIAGVYTAVFEEQYTKRIRFVKTDLQQIVPMKVVTNSADPFSDGYFYLCKTDLSLGDTNLGKVNMLFPLALLDLEGLREVDGEGVETEEVGEDIPQVTGELAAPVAATLDILLIGDDEAELVKIADILGAMDFGVKTLSFKDNVHNYIPGDLKAIYLVMKDVNEQAFGAAIKISSSCSLPLIAAGPEWTRTKVIKAVKYGIRDILLTPASKADIEENVTNNLLKLAA